MVHDDSLNPPDTPEASSPAADHGPGKVPTVDPDGGATLLAWLERKRRECPVWWDDSEHVHVFGHQDVQAILSDPATYSSDTVGRLSGGKRKAPRGTLLLLDPPLHGKMRRMVSRAFTNNLVAALEPWITELTGELLDAVDGDRFDLVDALANPLPVTVIAGMLGVPQSDRDLFQKWADQLLSTDPDDPDSVKQMEETAVGISSYLQDFIDARRKEPQDDLLGTLVHAEMDGEHLDDEDIASFSTLLLLAGHITTSVLIGNALLCLDATPGLLERVRADRSMIPAVVEETLRLRPPFTRIERVTTREVELGGRTVGPDTLVHLWLLSANQDGAVFEDPAAFSPGRSNVRQAAFGHGIHYCIGAVLARLEGRVVLNAMLDRFSAIRVDPEATLSFHGTNVYGARHLPLVVERA
ncbi:cytochrome P450 [Streptomyces sp. SL13]|uniref:Cytochrome P450 n=1 Tax=Streptantibioticus silvisoli TaxID=2705255 RepID=A0AA90GV91_9ACTN|nr:cytochrome P450 [Streptantibioticus silvisoli]